MAGNHTPAFAVIDVIDLSHVRGGGAQQSAVAQRALAGAHPAVQRAVAQALAGRADGDRVSPRPIADARPRSDDAPALPLLAYKLARRSGSGPTPAPALPPASTLTR